MKINLGFWREIIMRNWFQLLKTLSQAFFCYLILLWRIPFGRLTNRRVASELFFSHRQEINIKLWMFGDGNECDGFLR